MSKISRRDFIKVSSLTLGGTLAGGLCGSRLALSMLQKTGEEGVAAGAEGVIPTMCHGCSYGGYNCGVLAHVKEGVLTRVEGNPYHPLNRGRLCAMGNSAVQWVYNPQRLKYPLMRVGERGQNKFKRITWDEALDAIAGKLKEIKEKHGPEYIFLSKGQASSWFNLYHQVWARFLHALGSPNFTWWGPFVCFLPPLFYEVLTVGGPTYARPDYENADLILEWFTSGGKGGPARGGVETMNVNLRSVPMQILNRIKKGAKLVVINPQLIPIGANGRASRWLPVRPGTDAALALAMLHVTIKEKLYDAEFVSRWCHGFDHLKEHVQQYSPEWAEKITDIPAKDITAVARLYATTRRACIRFTESPEKADLKSLMTALAILIAVTGHLDRPGGNVYFYPAAELGIDTFDDRIAPDTVKRAFGSEKFFVSTMGGPTMTGADLITLIRGLTTGEPYRPKAALLFCTNPLSTGRNPALMLEALKKLELLVVVDIVATPTTRYADIILPSASRYESPGDPNIWQDHLSIGNQVIKPLWKSRNDLEMVLDLAARLGMGADFWDGDYNKMVNDYLKSTGVIVNQLRKNALKGIHLPRTAWMDQRERYEKHFAHLPENKVQLYNEIFKKGGYEPLPVYRGEPEDPLNKPELLKEYPLIFTDEHSDYLSHHSWMRHVPWLREIRKNNYVKINPKTAQEHGIKEGDWVEVVSPHGTMKAVAWIFAGIRPDTVMGHHGWWQGCDELALPEYSFLSGGTNPNVLFNWEARDQITENMTKNTLVSISKTTPPVPVQPIKEVV